MNLSLPLSNNVLSLIIVVISAIIVTQLRPKRYIMFDVGHNLNHLLRLDVLSTNINEDYVLLILKDTTPYSRLAKIR